MDLESLFSTIRFSDGRVILEGEIRKLLRPDRVLVFSALMARKDALFAP